MKLEAVLKHYGGIRQTAAALGITTQAVYLWQKKGEVPYSSQLLIELHSEGLLKAKKK